MTMNITEERIEERYARLDREAEAGGYHLNPDREFTRELVWGLLTNEERYGYPVCPCRVASGTRSEDLDIICPCDYRDPDLDEFDACFCALYVSGTILNGEKEAGSIPERRPPEEERREPPAFQPSGSPSPPPSMAPGTPPLISPVPTIPTSIGSGSPPLPSPDAPITPSPAVPPRVAPDILGSPDTPPAPAMVKRQPDPLPYPVWRCRVCGYLCARENPPGVCPVCKADRDRFERFM